MRFGASQIVGNVLHRVRRVRARLPRPPSAGRRRPSCSTGRGVDSFTNANRRTSRPRAFSWSRRSSMPVASSKNSRSRITFEPCRATVDLRRRPVGDRCRRGHDEPVLVGGVRLRAVGLWWPRAAAIPSSVRRRRRVPALTSRSSPMCSTPSSTSTATVRSLAPAAFDPLDHHGALELVVRGRVMGPVRAARAPPAVVGLGAARAR